MPCSYNAWHFLYTYINKIYMHMKKLVEENLPMPRDNSIVDSIPIYRIRMVKDIEFTPGELKEYMIVNSLDDKDIKKACIGLAKVKWRNIIKKNINNKTPDTIKEIDDKAFKFYI